MAGEEADFRRGGRDQFKLKLPNLGPLQKLVIQHDNSGRSPAWHLDFVEVTNEATGACMMLWLCLWAAVPQSRRDHCML